MNTSTIKRLAKYLNEEQLQLYIESSDCFMAYFRNKTTENLNRYKEANEKFLQSTSGKLPCEIIPLTVW